MRSRDATGTLLRVTLERILTRSESIAMGTGDMGCVYHAAVYELEEAAAIGADRIRSAQNLRRTASQAG